MKKHSTSMIILSYAKHCFISGVQAQQTVASSTTGLSPSIGDYVGSTNLMHSASGYVHVPVMAQQETAGIYFTFKGELNLLILMKNVQNHLYSQYKMSKT